MINAEVWLAVIAFGAAICLTDGFDISLPRGDSFGVSGALIAAGFLVLGEYGPHLIMFAGLFALLMAHLVRQRGRVGIPTLVALAIRGSSIAILWPLLSLMRLSVADAPVALTALIAAGVYLGTELLLAQAWLTITTGRPFGRLLTGNMRRQTPIIAAQVSVSALVVVTYPSMDVWALLPVTAMLLLIRQSYALLLQMRETLWTTVEVLVEAAEGQHSNMRGHADRTAHITRAICMRLGMTAHHVERASYAALLHNLVAISGGPEEGMPQSAACSSQVLEGVTFLSDVVPIMRLCDGAESLGVPKETDLVIAMAVGLACEIDSLRNDAVVSAHVGSALQRVGERASRGIKAQVVSAALELGYEIPAVS
jgi:hypothetical protein